MTDSRRELAEALMRAVHRRRLERIGEPVPHAELSDLSEEDQRNWLDLADAVSDLPGTPAPTAQLRSLCDDYDRYTRTIINDPGWRDDMRRAVLLEMSIEVEKLTKATGWHGSEKS